MLFRSDAIREQTEAWAESAENDALTKAVEAKRSELANLRYDVATSQVEYTASWKKWQAAEEERLTLYNDPVSYTHLDVYKRQANAVRRVHPALPWGTRQASTVSNTSSSTENR